MNDKPASLASKKQGLCERHDEAGVFDDFSTVDEEQCALCMIERLTCENADLADEVAEAAKELGDVSASSTRIAHDYANLLDQCDRLRALVQRAHTIIGIREVAHETHKGKAWLEQATRELNGEPSPAPETSERRTGKVILYE